MADDPLNPMGADQSLFPMLGIGMPAGPQPAQQPQMPATAPAPAGPSAGGMDPLTSSMIQASRLGQEQYSVEAARRATLAQQLDLLMKAQQAQGANPPKMGYEPGWEHGHGVGGAIRNVGRGILTGLESTGPGRAVEESVYGPGMRRYQSEMGTRAQQIADIQKQMGSETEAQTAATGMTAKPMTAMARYGAAVLNDQTRRIHNDATEKLRAELTQVQKQLGEGKITAENARTQADMIIARGHDSAIQNVAGTYSDQRDRDEQIQAEESEWSKDILGIKGALGTLFGAAPPPSQRGSAPPGPKARGSKVAPAKAVAPSSTPPQGATHKGMGPDGQMHWSNSNGDDLGVVQQAPNAGTH